MVVGSYIDRFPEELIPSAMVSELGYTKDFRHLGDYNNNGEAMQKD